MKKLTFLLFALFTALVFTACSGNSQPNDLASVSGTLVLSVSALLYPKRPA
jgi:hypothetical protein